MPSDAQPSAQCLHAAVDGAQQASKSRGLSEGRCSSESSGAKWPLTKTSWQAAPGTRYGSRSRGLKLQRCPWPRAETESWPSGARLVKRQSSSCVVGKSLGVEARPGVLAQLPQPHRLALLPPCGKFAIRFEITVHSAFRSPSPFVLASNFRPSMSNSRAAHAGRTCASGFGPSRSPSLRVPAPAPGRPSARSFHRPARAQNRERCNRAGAGSA